MASWGAWAFGNGIAQDLAAAVEGVDDLVAAFVAKPGAEIGADIATTILAAAECVAAMLGRPSGDLPKSDATRLRSFGVPDARLVQTARDQVALVLSNSALPALCGEAGRADDFHRAVTELIDRLYVEIGPKAAKNHQQELCFNPSLCAFCNRPMGEEDFGMLDLSVDLGDDYPVQLGKWAHLSCLNDRLHPSHTVQARRSDPETTPAGSARFFGDNMTEH